MGPSFIRVVFTFLFFAASLSTAHGLELKTRYTTIVYKTEDLLRKFNKEVSLGSLSYIMRNTRSITAEDEAKNKVDVIIEKVESLLEMFPKNLKFRMMLLPGEKDVQRVYREKYRTEVDYIAFYSPQDETVYVSVEDVRRGVLAHELAHVVIDHYYGVPTPVRIHEILAQFAESHLED
jgi:hypothetical protein